MRNWSRLICWTLTLLLGATTAVYAAEGIHDCDGADLDKRIEACTALIETPDAPPERRATAYANRAFTYSIRGQYQTAIQDFDAAIQMFPEFAAALNNRAWAYFKWGKIPEADVDTDRSLRVDPVSAATLDTRGHVSQWLGNQPIALRAYDMAMVFGGSRMVGIYQCGLRIQKLYSGPIDGNVSAELRTAMRLCVEKGSACDPLPPDEECGAAS